MVSIIVIGPAGSGKTTLVKALGQHLNETSRGPLARIVNLDAGSGDSHAWDLDIRDCFTIVRIMEEYDVGPNGATMKAFELLPTSIDTLFGPPRDDKKGEITILDAPGQIESLLFFRGNDSYINYLMERFEDLVGVFLIPATAINDPATYASMVLLLSGIHLQVPIPLVHVVSKADLLEEGALEHMNDSSVLESRILEGRYGQLTGFALHATRMMGELFPVINPSLISISGQTTSGLDDLMDLVAETGCACGDLS